MTIAQAWQSASRIILLGPQEQSYGRYDGTLADCQLDATRIGAHFVECRIDNTNYMFDLEGCLIYVW
jgi:hypothetical protein